MFLVDIPQRVFGEVSGLASLPRNIEKIAESMEVLPEVHRQLEVVAQSTASLPHIDREMTVVAETMPSLIEMLDRMNTIAEAMPALHDVRRSLATLPETMEELDAAVARLLVLVDGLTSSLIPIQTAAERLGTSRLLGRRRRSEPVADGKAEA